MANLLSQFRACIAAVRKIVGFAPDAVTTEGGVVRVEVTDDPGQHNRDPERPSLYRINNIVGANISVDVMTRNAPDCAVVNRGRS
jgi:hypothetical protein